MKFFTLGPRGSCHEHALKNYLRFQGVADPEIGLVDTILEGAEAARSTGDGYLLQCSAHLDVHIVTEKYLGILHVVDTFIFPTQAMALLKRREVDEPKSIGLPEAAMGYIDPEAWQDIVLENTKPTVARNLLRGKYDAGLAYVHTAREHPDRLDIMHFVGEVVTTWILFGPTPRYDGELIGQPFPELGAKGGSDARHCGCRSGTERS